jgi:hypothetical protein
MTEKPAETTKTAAKKAAPTKTAKPTASSARATRRRRPSHDKIAERAYFIHIEQGSGDEVGNWLRAEGELMAA